MPAWKSTDFLSACFEARRKHLFAAFQRHQICLTTFVLAALLIRATSIYLQIGEDTDLWNIKILDSANLNLFI